MLLSEVKGVGKVTLSKLKSLNIQSVSDLLNFLPKTYVDLTSPVSLQEVSDGDYVYLKLKLVKVGHVVRTKSKLQFFNVDATDCVEISEKTDKNYDKNAPRTARLVWFNQPYIQASLIVGGEYFCFGKIKRAAKYFELVNPMVEFAVGAKKLSGIIPVYRTKNLVYQQSFRSILKDAVDGFGASSLIPKSAEKDRNLMGIDEAYRKAHFPTTIDEAYAAHRRIILDDTVKLITYYKLFRREQKNERSVFYNQPFSVVDRFTKGLSFKLTESQQTALFEINADLHANERLNRILAGDVGSGKTVVAFSAMYYAVSCGYQAVLMAPTEILAQQHFKNAQKFFNGLGVRIVYLSSAVIGAERKTTLAKIALGEADIIIGTHALFQKDVSFRSLSFVVIDEQHKFGVVQKYGLEEKGVQADVLTLSATPIPRSMALVLYDELKLSEIFRASKTACVKTAIVPDSKRNGMFSYIKGEVQKGNRAFIVCPRIADSEGLDVYSAKELYTELKKGAFADVNVGLLHGKLKTDEKNAVMQAFADGELSVLISTTVVEVGIDIKEATIIAVLNADRFGLSTLHQLRGRVGRGDRDGYCFLHTKSLDNERLQVLVDNVDGFRIAEMDFALRGGGDFLGTRQKGDTFDSRYAVRLTPDLIRLAKDIAVNDVLPSLTAVDRTDFARYYDILKDVTLS
jgi:RecG-like helicase